MIESQADRLIVLMEELVGAVDRRNELAEREAEVVRQLTTAVRDQSVNLRDIHAAVETLVRVTDGRR